MFSIPEKMYYYIKLNSPIAVLCTTVSTSYNLDLKALIDLGNYYGYIAFNFSIGSYNSIYASLYKRYMEKENLPREKVLTCFEPQKIKFLSKEEDALVLQFPNFIYCLGLLTFELFSITDSDLKLGELIHISYAGMLEWRLDDTEIIFKQSPINFNDRNYGDSVFESQDTLKIVKVEYDNTTYANMIYI